MPAPTMSRPPAATLMLMPPPSVQSPQKGRGTVWAIEHRFNERSRDEFDDGGGMSISVAAGGRDMVGVDIL